MSRRCAKCLRTGMHNDVRHVHELEPGAKFKFDDSDEVYEVASHGDGTSFIRPVAVRTVKKTITPRFAEARTFEVQERAPRRCAPGAQVIPV